MTREGLQGNFSLYFPPWDVYRKVDIRAVKDNLTIIRWNFETHLRFHFNLNPFDHAATDIVSEFGTKAGSVTYKQSADNACAGTHSVGEQLSVNYRTQPEWAVRGAIE